MTTDKKLYIAVGVLAALGGAVFLQNKQAQQDERAHSIEGATESLPKIAVSEEDTKKVDKIELVKPADGDGGAAETIVLVKKGENDWVLDKPVAAKATASNVTSLLDNLKRLEVKELIDPGKGSYAKFEVSDDKALHATFYKGADKALEAYFGADGSRGQMTRIAGKDGVFAVKGYSSFLFTRDVKGWREKGIVAFEEKDVVKVGIDNENGSFTFTKDGEEWKSQHKGPKAAGAKAIDEFEKSKLENMIRAYKSLNAADFGDGKTLVETGLEKPAATVTFEMKEGSAKHVISVGGTADGGNRWVKKNGSDQIFAISSWASDWATAKPEKFQKGADDDKKAEGDAPEGMPAMPAGMQMPQMPSGHP